MKILKGVNKMKIAVTAYTGQWVSAIVNHLVRQPGKEKIVGIAS